jgi:NitT/TauT family transport system permease protein
MSRLGRIAAPAALVLLLVIAWQGACVALKVPTYLVPTPLQVAAAIAGNGPLLAISAWNTLAMALIALAIAALLGCGLAVLVATSQVLENATRPLAVTLQVTPVVAIAPLVAIWSGVDHPVRAVIALAVVIAFFPIFSGALTGMKSADANLERLFDLYGAGRIQRLARLRLPAAIPHILQGVKVAAGLAVVGTVIAEYSVSGGAQGLAWRILEASNRLQTAKEFAALVVLAVMGAGLYGLLELAERRLLAAWRGR